MKQPDDYTCGPASIFYYINHCRFLCLGQKDPTFNELVKLTQCTEENGVTHDGMKQAFNHLYTRYDSGFFELADQLIDWLPCIVNWFKIDDGHYSVALKIDSTRRLIYWDPEDDELHSMKLEEFDNVWYSKRYGKRWMIK